MQIREYQCFFSVFVRADIGSAQDQYISLEICKLLLAKATDILNVTISSYA